MDATLQHIVDTYRCTKQWHDTTLEAFNASVELDPELIAHKRYSDHWIYGEVGFHHLWNLLVRNSPNNLRFLEIGVFKGQVISLIGLLANRYDKTAFIVGVSPFDGRGDKYSRYDKEFNYKEQVLKVWQDFQPAQSLDPSKVCLFLIEGSSTDDHIVNQVAQTEPYDIIYIDGCHDYDYVTKDIRSYSSMVKIGGFLVMDDAATDCPMSRWNGHEEVGRATRELLDTNTNFRFLFAVGHIKLYQRVK